MKAKETIQHDRYIKVEYSQFNQTSRMKWSIKIAGWLSLLFIYPLILIARVTSHVGFVTISEFLSLIPYAIGVIVRYEFYRRTLKSCGHNVFIGFGTVFFYPDVSIGNNVLMGSYNTIHFCDFGNNVMVGSGCRFQSGSKSHSFDDITLPMTQQGGRMKHIRIGDDTWIGANSIIMDHIADGCVVGAGSVVNKEFEPYSVVVGNPARVLKKRISE